jgi:LysM repeat protein
MTSAGFCKKAACLIFCWCAFLPFSAFAGVTYQKDYVVKQDLENRILCEPYVVQKNDSLALIFQEKGGIIDENPEDFLRIFKRLNPQVSDIEKIQPGQQVFIPLKKMEKDREISSRIFTLPMVTISADKKQQASEPKPSSDDSGFTEYKIKPGDTLSRIFHKYFGSMNVTLSGDRLRLFQKINPDITDINRIYPDQTIRMPLSDSTGDFKAALEDPAAPLERVSWQLNARLTRKGICFFPMPGKADFGLDMAQFPIMEFSDGLRILFNPGQTLKNEEQNVVLHFWPELNIIDISYDASAYEILDQVLKVAPYLGQRLNQNSREGNMLLRSTLPLSANLSAGWHVSVRGKQQLVETLMRILDVSYTQNVEMSFPYADIQISSHTNWIESGKGKPVLVDFGSFYGDAIQALEKTGFVVVQILDTDSIRQSMPRLLNAIGVSFTMDSELQMADRQPLTVPGIWIQRDALPTLILTDADLDPYMIQAIQEKRITLITEKKKTG